MRLEQMTYQPIQRFIPEQRQRIYSVINLRYLSASAFYTGDAFGGLGGDVGSSGFDPWLADPQPMPDLEIRTPDFFAMLNTGRVTQTSPSSLLYTNSRGDILGGIDKLNLSEMDLLLKKHFDIDK